ncbi:hypothetical protein BDV93DRAFT_609644 [Ceratobasidium sp. AG-I]|nr:hypothetical protein BDV93DRAFT_609644 [Ceratobasidium sp. AG-I]
MLRVSFTHWFHWLSLIRLAFDTVACWTLLEGGVWQWLPALRISGKGPVARATIVMVIWSLSLGNGLFLLFIDFMRTNTHWGCFLVQQVISASILVLMAVWMIIYRFDPNPWPVAWGLSSASLGLTLIISLALWYRFIAAGKSAQWRINAGELAANITPPTKNDNSGFGVRRNEEQTKGHVLSMFYYSLFRTVRPVESIPYALSHNIFALAAVILIIMRLVCSIFDIGSGDFLTRIIVEPCADWATVPSGQADKWGLSLVVGHPEDRGVDVGWMPNSSEYSSQVQVVIGSISGSLGYDDATDGAKLITPFGFVGNFLPSKDFQDRLQKHYYPTQKTPEDQARVEQETVLMTRFLLDYVIDMGPVPKAPLYSTPPEGGPRPEYQRIPSSSSDQNGQDTDR